MNNIKSISQSVYTVLAVTLATVGGCALQANQAVDSTVAPSAKAEVAEAATAETRVQATVQQLVQLGPRVTGTAAAQTASQFLVEEYRKAGYETRLQTFTYSKFRDLGSTIRVDGAAIAAQAMNNSLAGQVTGRMIAVPDMGRTEDFAAVDVKGAIAVVRRGQIPFSQKADNAAQAGAIALIVVNSADAPLRGTLGRPATIPVLGVASRAGAPFLNPAPDLKATVNVNTQQQTITGRNVIAHWPGVTQPRLLIGGHYDSVAGSPGANDNASGTAVVLEMARRMANTPQGRDVWFMAFDGEEDGLHGSRYFANTAPPQFLSGLTAMFNFDMVGVNDRLLVSGSAALRSRVKQLNATDDAGANGSSDHASFAAKGVPVLFFHRGLDANYHSPGDRTTNPKELNNTLQAGLESVYQVLRSP